MAIISDNAQTEILKIVVGLFNAVPGQAYMTLLADDIASGVAGGLTEEQSIAKVTNAVAKDPIFTQGVMGGKVTVADQVSVLLSNFGLKSDGVPGSDASLAASEATDYFTARINHGDGFGAIVFDAVHYLSGSPAPEFANAATLLANKALVAQLYSTDHPSGDLATLQHVLIGVTGAALYTEADALAAMNASFGGQQLTTGNDTIDSAATVTGDLTSFFYNGKGPTLNAGDHLSNITNLIISDQAATGVDLVPVGANLSNIQNMSLNTNANAGSGGTPWDTSGISGVLTSAVLSNGSGSDVIQAASTTTETINHTNTSVGGDVTALGGSNVTVTTKGGDVTVGNSGKMSAPATGETPTGDVTVTQMNSGAGGAYVNGGHNVAVTVTSSANTGGVEIGNTNGNTGNTVAGIVANPTGDVSVTDAGHTNGEGTGAITVFGGNNVSIVDTALGGTSSAAGIITVGDISAVDPSNQPAGKVTIAETARTTYDGLAGITHNNGVAGSINVLGGTDVSVTTNAGGDVSVGDSAKNGTNPSGSVSIVSTGLADANNSNAKIGVAGGKDVSVTAAGSNVIIGQEFGSDAKAADNPTGAINVTQTAAGGFWTDNTIDINGGTSVNVASKGQDVFIADFVAPTGAVTVNQSDVITGWSGYAKGQGDVNVLGGTDVTVNTTGGDVFVGGFNEGEGVTGFGVTGAVNVANTFSGSNTSNEGSADWIEVYGGTTVNVSVGATSGHVIVGHLSGLNSDGVTLKNPNLIATGDIVVNNSRTNGSITTYGTGDTNVVTNGSAQVTLTGGTVQDITDAQTTLATSGSNSGQAIGASKLATVVIDGNQSNEGTTTIKSDALANLTITNSQDTEYVVTDATKNHDLSLTLGGNLNVNDEGVSVTDAQAGKVTIKDNAKDSTAIQTLDFAVATALTFQNTASQIFDLTKDSAVTSIVASNTGALDLGNLSNNTQLASIDASKATGDIKATIDGSITGFKGVGSTGNETITLSQNAVTQDVFAGSGNNTLVAAYTGQDIANGGTDQALGNTSHIKGFSTFEVSGLGSGSFDAGSFAHLAVDNPSGNVVFDNAQAGVDLGIANSTGNSVNLNLANSSKSNDSLAVNVNDASVDLTAAGIENVTINSHITPVDTTEIIDDSNEVVLHDQGTGVNGDVGLKTLTITGDTDIVVKTDWTATDASGYPTETNLAAAKVIDASAATGKVDVSHVALADAGVSITGGAGLLTADLSLNGMITSVDQVRNVTTAADAVTTGAGGGDITLGGAGSFNAGYTAGSQTINLGASAGVTDTIRAHDGAVATNNGTSGGINSFNIGVAVSDDLNFDTTKTALQNTATTPIIVQTLDTTGMANVLDTSGALFTALANLTYTATNGVITFSATGGHHVSEFSAAQLISAAEIIVNATGANEIAGFSVGGNSYVVASDAANTLFSGVTTADTIEELNGVTSLTGFGLTGAAGAIVSSDVANIDADLGAWTLANPTETGTATAQVIDDKGFSLQTLALATLNQVSGSTLHGTQSYTLNNLAASSQIRVDSGSGATPHIGDITTTQLASAGNNSLSVDLSVNNNNTTIDTLTVNGDGAMTFNPNTSEGASTVSSLVDATNTLKTINVGIGASGQTLALDKITSTSLQTIDASKSDSIVNLGNGTALSQAGLTIKMGVNGGTIDASGAGVIVTQEKNSEGSVNFTGNGKGDSITLYNGGNTISANGDNDVITVGTGMNTVTATGAHDVINVDVNSGVSDFTVGSNAVINFTKVNVDGKVDGNGTHDDTVFVGNDVTGGTSASFNFVTLNGATSDDTISFSNDSSISDLLLGANVASSQVNVATATTLAQALDIAANITALKTSPGDTDWKLGANHGVVDWFQYAGNTYVVESVNNGSSDATHTSLGSHDIVVQLTGLVDIQNVQLG